MGFRDLILSILCASTFVLCNTGAKLSLTTGREWLMFPVYGGSVLAFWLFRRVCTGNGLAVASGMIDTMATVISVFIGIFILKEELQMQQYLGLIVLFVGLYLIH